MGHGRDIASMDGDGDDKHITLPLSEIEKTHSRKVKKLTSSLIRRRSDFLTHIPLR